MSNVGDNIKADRGNWSFGGEVANTFDYHVSKSVPLYFEGHQLIKDLSDFFVKSGSTVYDVGCSTGTLLAALADHHKDTDNCNFIGLDIEQPMIDNAKKKYKDKKNIDLKVENVLETEFEKTDLVICYYTIQFMRTSARQDLINKIYKSLNWGGAFIMFEKVRASDARFQDIMTSLYNEYKLLQNYTADSILAKTRSLKGVLEPFSTQGNIDMLKRAGFVDINTIQKYICFEGFLAIK